MDFFYYLCNAINNFINNHTLMKKILVSIIILSFTLPILFAQHQKTTNNNSDTQELLCKLDESLTKVSDYDYVYESSIATLKAKLRYATDQSGSLSLYKTQEEIYQYYAHYQSDSAITYLQQNIDLATKMNWPAELAKSQLNYVHLLNTMGLLLESKEVLSNIDRNSLSVANLSQYYSDYMDYYIYCQERVLGMDYADTYLQMANRYADSTLFYMNQDTPEAINVQLWKEAYNNPLDTYNMIIGREESFSFGTRPYSILMSLKAFACFGLKRHEERKQCLALSAMSDIYASIKENTSLRDLANMIYDDGDYTRANRYLKKCISDSQFFNSRHRNSQNSQILPKIDAAYTKLQEKHTIYLYCGVASLTILSAILALVLLSLHKQKNKVEVERSHAEKASEKALEATQQALKATQEALKSNQMLQESSARLAESNRIKEEYLGRYMSQCTNYLQQLDSYRKRMYKLSQTTKMSDLQQVLRSEMVIEDTYKDFYQDFDKSFFELFPNFVEQVNKLMIEGEEFHLKGENQLNSELRVLALLRLGIQDNTQMANFLRCTKSTIYTYRSKLKNRAVNPNDFEETIMHNL